MSMEEYYLKELKKGILGRGKSSQYFKRLVKLMYEGYPNSRVSEKVINAFVVTDKDREFLCEHGFFLREPANKGFDYGLGPLALQVVSSWKTEELTEKIKFLTIIMLFFAVGTFFMAVFQIIISSHS